MGLLSNTEIKISLPEEIDEESKELLIAIAQDNSNAIEATKKVVTEQLVQNFITKLKEVIKQTSWYNPNQ